MSTSVGARAPGTTAAVLLGRRALRDAAVRLTAGSTLWLGLLLVTYWWIADGAVADIALGWSAGLSSIGRWLGLVASVLLLAQVVLMARVPVLEQAFGQDRLARIHRIVGFTSFTLMLAHVVLSTWGVAAGRLTRLPAALWDLTWQDPGMLLAAAGTVCLVLVVVTSIKAARRRLRYESWHLLHLYAYLGVGLALPHQLWTGKQFEASTTRVVCWWTAWALAGASVLVWRVTLPAWRTLRCALRVSAVVQETPDVWSIHLTGRLDRLRVEAGQFLNLRFLRGAGWSRANPYSLSAAPDGRRLRVTVQEVGDGSRLVKTLRPGTRVLVEGPYGRLSARARTRRKVAFIGAGLGLTPLRALAEGLDYEPGDAVLIVRCTQRPLFADEIRDLVDTRGLVAFSLPGPRRASGSWLSAHADPVSDTDALRAWVPDITDRDVFVCGPEPWAALVRRSLEQAGLPPRQLHLESFAW